MSQPTKRCRLTTSSPSSLPSMRTHTTGYSTSNMERATLKVEIPFTDHAHCIGRQGNQIQSIMSATDTHIHFPDGNREPNGTKSNQVSITGTIPAIEQARKRIREILPMSLKFLIPPTQLIHIINDDYPLFKNVRARFGVVVLPRPYAKTGDVYCIVRGLINQPGLAEATDFLIQAFYGFEAPLVKVTCQTEVSEQYHVYLQTRQQAKDMCIPAIEQYTHTTIQFPTTINSTMNNTSEILSNGNASYGRRTSVTITGSPAQVCQARKLFDLCLPIILTFEIPTDKEPTRAQTVHIKDKLNVTTTVRTRKDKIGKQLITVQSQEYNSDQLFRARSLILGIPDMGNNNHILPASTNNNNTSLFDLNMTSTFLSDLSVHAQSSSLFLASPTTTTTTTSTGHLADSIFIPIEPCYVPSPQQLDTLLVPLVETPSIKKPSPIGHERSSSRNLDQESSLRPTHNDQFASLLVFDPAQSTTVNARPSISMKMTNINNLEPPHDNSLTVPTSSSLLLPSQNGHCPTKLFALLRSMNLEKYWSAFERNEIDYCTFLSMTDSDLTQIGIEAFGARRRMQQAITDHVSLAGVTRYQ